MMMMRVSCLMEFSFLLLLLLGSAMAGTPDLIDDTCKKIAANDTNVDSAFCVESLRHYPAAAAACDLRGLAVAATSLAAANATSVKAAVEAALRKGETKGRRRLNPYERSCLEVCLEVFDYAVSDLTEAADMLAAGSLDHSTIIVHLSAALDAPATCEDGFSEGGIASPLAKEDNALFQLVAIALVIVDYLR